MERRDDAAHPPGPRDRRSTSRPPARSSTAGDQPQLDRPDERRSRASAPTPTTTARYGFIFGGGGSGTYRDDPSVPTASPSSSPRGSTGPGRPADTSPAIAGRSSERARHPDDVIGGHARSGSCPRPVVVPTERRRRCTRPGRRGPDDRAADAGVSSRSVLLVGGLLVLRRVVRVRDRLCPPGAGAHPRIAGEPAGRVATPARVRGRRQPRAADAADRHPQQRRASRPTSRRDRRLGRVRARGHRRRGPSHDLDRRGPAAPRQIRFGCRRARAHPGRPGRRGRRRGLGHGQARDGPRGPGRGRPATGGRGRRPGPVCASWS